MFNKLSIGAFVAATVLTAAPALAAVNPTGGQAGGMWTQEAPTRYLNTEMGAVLAPRVQYLRTNGSGIDFNMGLGGGSEVGVGLSAVFNTTTNLNAGLNGMYKYQLTRAGNMALALKVGAGITNVGGGTPGFGISAGLPMTFDVGTTLLSLHPMVSLPNLASGTTGASVGVPIGIQAPLANFWSLIADVSPTFGIGSNTFTYPIQIGARLSPTAMSHVDFTVAQIPSFSPFTATVGTAMVTGHVGFR